MKYVGIGLLILFILWLAIHWYKWNECRKANGNQPNCATQPCPFIYGDCDFLSLKPKFDSEFEKCRAENKNKADGEVCTNCIPDGSLQPNWGGTIQNGVCIKSLQPNTPPVTPTYNLEVTNPKGAGMYYQYTTPAGGIAYSKSNVILPFGTKLNLIKFHQTSLNNMPLSGYYETDYKVYGSDSGYFETTDLKKI